MGTLAATGVKVGMAVALALAATIAARYLHQARQGWRPGWRPGGRHLRVLETTALGQQRAVHLVAVGQRTLLIGTTQGQVAMLADVTGECCDPPTEQAAAGDGFAAFLSRLLPERGMPGDGHVGRLQAAAQTLRTGDRPGGGQ